ncbi:Ig-like domain-containing protein [Streptomyces sp. NPDC058251]|uniref:Ig-like domain-containing protein n=1 Tax=unclassified Streptomyces TaxID=2593676 RepID=UPI00365007CE
MVHPSHNVSPGEQFTVTVTVTPQRRAKESKPLGSIKFTSSWTFCDATGCSSRSKGSSTPVSLANGRATLTETYIAEPGTYQFRASYTGDAAFSPSKEASATLTVADSSA